MNACRAAIILALLLTFALLPAQSAGQRDWDACDNGTGDAAIAACTRIIVDESECEQSRAIAHYNLGLRYYRMNNYGLTRAHYDAAIRLHVELAAAWLARGNLYKAVGQYERAIDDITMAIRLDRDFAAAYSDRGLAYHEKGEIDRALADYDKAIRIDPDYAPAYNGRGNIYVQKGDLDRAIAELNEAIRRVPDHAQTYNNRGLTYYEKGEVDRALADYDEALRIDPGFASAYYNRGRARRAEDDDTGAQVDLNRAADLGSQPAIREIEHAILQQSGGKTAWDFIEDEPKASQQRSGEADAAAQSSTQEKSGTPDMPVRARHILVRTEAEAQAIIEQLEAGADFAELAMQRSTVPSAANGGDVGYFARGEMIKEIEDVAFALKPGEVSKPVKTKFGWRIIKVEKTPPRPIPPTNDELRRLAP